jgi:hypothetical protein
MSFSGLAPGTLEYLQSSPAYDTKDEISNDEREKKKKSSQKSDDKCGAHKDEDADLRKVDLRERRKSCKKEGVPAGMQKDDESNSSEGRRRRRKRRHKEEGVPPYGEHKDEEAVSIEMELNVSPALKRTRKFSIEPDVEVEVEGEVFRVHSYVLMSQSSVFSKMLSSEMLEATSGRILLTRKSKVEFKEFLSHLQNPVNSALSNMDPKMAEMLVVWADEYDIVTLKKTCEEALMKDCQSKDDWRNFELATKFNMKKMRRRSLRKIVIEIFKSRNHLLEILEQPDLPDLRRKKDRKKDHEKNLGLARYTKDKEDKEAATSSVKRSIWSQLYKGVFLPVPNFDELPSLADLGWPIIVRALELADGWSDLEESNDKTIYLF